MAPKPVLVSGVLAATLADSLAAGGDRGLVRTVGDAETAAVVVRVLGGPPSAEDLAELRRATRATVPTIAVQTGASERTEVPYVLATDVIVCPPGKAFPLDEISERIAAAVGEDGIPLAARVPRLRPFVQRALVRRAALANGVLAAAPWGEEERMPLLSLAEARMLVDLDASDGTPIPHGTPEALRAVAPEVGVAVAGGFLLREAYRRLPVKNAIVAGAIAYLGTRALGEAAARR